MMVAKCVGWNDGVFNFGYRHRLDCCECTMQVFCMMMELVLGGMVD